jgi:predicted DNA-binding WGR domain protein
MDNLLSVTFEAHNDERNHHRRYEIRLGRDLFGEWTVALSYGRTGRSGQVVRHSAADSEQLRKVVRETLRRRLSVDRKGRRGDLAFKIDPDSVQFHLFEARS